MPAQFSLEIKHFQGPLDLLLDLIQERKLYINDVALAEVTDAYLSYLEQTPELPVGETAQFVLVASTLLLIKSRSLLPNLELSEDEEAQIEDLERRLALYRIIKTSTKEVASVWGTHPHFFPKKTPAGPIIFSPDQDVTLLNIESAMQKVIAELPVAAFAPTARVAPSISLHEMITKLEERIMRASKTKWSDISKNATKHDRVVQFLAVLELMRRGKVIAEQSERFGDIIFESDSIALPRYE